MPPLASPLRHACQMSRNPVRGRQTAAQEPATFADSTGCEGGMDCAVRTTDTTAPDGTIVMTESGSDGPWQRAHALHENPAIPALKGRPHPHRNRRSPKPPGSEPHRESGHTQHRQPRETEGRQRASPTAHPKGQTPSGPTPTTNAFRLTPTQPTDSAEDHAIADGRLPVVKGRGGASTRVCSL